MNRHNKIRQCGIVLVTALLVPCLTGCDSLRECSTTSAMWENERAESHYHPAENANLKLAHTTDTKDVLVEYDEVYERTGKVTRRAFLLHENEKRVVENRKPHFVSTDKASRLRAAPIDVSSETNAQPGGFPQMYAVLAEDGCHFTFVTGGDKAGPYALPGYPNARSRALKISLTPATVTCDAVIYTVLVGSVVGIVAVCMYGGGSQTPFSGKH
jgi:hypothetical protein